jgi:hypothetical protein
MCWTFNHQNILEMAQGHISISLTALQIQRVKICSKACLESYVLWSADRPGQEAGPSASHLERSKECSYHRIRSICTADRLGLVARTSAVLTREGPKLHMYPCPCADRPTVVRGGNGPFNLA